MGFLLEKLFHPKSNLKEIAKLLKSDVHSIIMTLFEQVPIRHEFDITLFDDMQVFLKEYSKVGFDIKMQNLIDRDVPVIWIRFVPKMQFELEDIIEIMNFAVLKFREYINFYNLHWKSFGSYSSGSDYLNIYIYYSEYPCDEKAFMNLYRMVVRRKNKNAGGVLRDAELDEELKYVD